MASTAKTTVYLDPRDYERIKDIARVAKRTPAELIREAVSTYADRYGPRRTPACVGSGRSGKVDLSERVDELLEGMGKLK
jgi:hypothetical protein